MKISTKLALVLSVTVALSVAACCLAFVSLQRRALRRAEAEKEHILLESVRKTAEESLLAADPLMLMSRLTDLRRDRPEVHAVPGQARRRMADRWEARPRPVTPRPRRG